MKCFAILASLLLAQSAAAAEWYMYVSGSFTPQPAGSDDLARYFHWYGDGHEPIKTVGSVWIERGEVLPTGATFRVTWDADELRPCAECSDTGLAGGEARALTGFSVVRDGDSYLVTSLQDWPGFQAPYFAVFTWYGLQPIGDGEEDVTMTDLPPANAGEIEGVSYEPLVQQCVQGTPYPAAMARHRK